MKENEMNLEIRQGSDYLAQIEMQNDDGSPVDLTTCSFAGQARTKYDAVNPSFEFVFTVVNALAGIVNVSLPNNFYTKKMIIEAVFVYDWEFTDSSGKIKTLAWGTLSLLPEVTK